MAISVVNRVKTITIALDRFSSNNIIPVYQNSGLSVGDEFLPGYKVISFNAFIKNLKAYAKIQSIEEAKLPEFTLEDSETDKAYKTLDVEWTSERKQLNLFISSDNNQWFPVASVSLLNPSGYPFRIYNLQDLYTNNLAIELGSNSRVGVQIQDVGYGYLEQTDTVTIHGSYVEEIILEHKEVLAAVEVQNTIEPKETSIVINNVIPESSTGSNTNNTEEEDDDMANWLIKNADYTAVNKDKIIIEEDVNIQITLPAYPSPGSSIALLKLSNSSYQVNINLNNAKYKSGSPNSLILESSNTEVKLIYVSTARGWTPSLDIFTENQGNQSTQ